MPSFSLSIDEVESDTQADGASRTTDSSPSADSAVTDDAPQDGLAMTTARNATVAPAAEDRRWNFGVAPCIWATSMKGRGTVKGVDGEVDDEFKFNIRFTGPILGWAFRC